MIISTFLAHAGEQHDTTTKAVLHMSQDPVLLWLILILLPIVIAFFTHTVFKMKLFNTLLWISFFLIGFSVYSYQNPGAHTIAALGSGFAIVFVTAILGLTSE